jgi:hypothetical protein
MCTCIMSVEACEWAGQRKRDTCLHSLGVIKFRAVSQLQQVELNATENHGERI